jgi:16S rRNA (adenine(1408)-N(1))-methyltransferase
VEVIQGKRTFEMEFGEFHALISEYPRVVVDVGTGDGRFVYEIAQCHPEWFCIGVDPARENLEDYSAKIYRKAKKGGLSNVLYVIASAEALPSELEGLADAIHINFPWGSLLEAVLLADQQVLANLNRMANPGASLTMLINAGIFYNPIPLRVQGLPELTLDYVDHVMTPAYARAHIRIVKRRALSEEDMLQVQTTWGKRLAYGKDPYTFYVKAVIGDQGRDGRGALAVRTAG